MKTQFQSKKNHYKNYLYTKKSVLTVAILAVIAGNVAHAGDTVTCSSSDNCSVDGGQIWDVGSFMFKNSVASPQNGQDGNTKSLSDNTVTLNWESGSQPDITNVFGAFTKEDGLDISHNIVNINEGKIDKFVVGAFSLGKGSPTKNIINIRGGNVGYNVNGGYTFNGDAIGNTISISDGTVDGRVYAGFSARGGDALDNNIIISGGELNGSIHAGQSDEGNSTGNSITIKEKPIFGNDVELYGGKSNSKNPGDVLTGNTLNLRSKDITIKDVKNFENYHFYLTNDVKKDDTILNLTTTEETDLSKIKYGVAIEVGSSTLKVNDKVTLIDTAGKLKLKPDLTNTITGMQGISTVYTFSLKIEDENKLVAQVVTAPAPNPAPSNVVNCTALTNCSMAGGQIWNVGPRMKNVLAPPANTSGAMASVDDNKVTLNWTDSNPQPIIQWVIGGLTTEQDKNVTGNNLNITKGDVDFFAYGGVTKSGDSKNNHVEIEGGYIGLEAFGAISYQGNSTENSVLISGGEVGSIAGGSSIEKDSIKNKIIIQGGEVSASVWGGYISNRSGKGNTRENSVSMNNGSVDGTLYGGKSYSGTSIKNEVEVTGGTIGSTYGGYSEGGITQGNKVKTADTQVENYIYGGYSETIEAIENTVTINDATVGKEVYGGMSLFGKANNNIATAHNATIKKSLYGGYSDEDTVSGNSVTLSGTSTIGDPSVIKGGRIYGGYSENGLATRNSVIIEAGTIKDKVYGGFSKKKVVSQNTVTINGGAINSHVTGGRNGLFVKGANADDLVAKDNTVTINGGIIKKDVYAGASLLGNAVNNNVFINEGTIDGHIIGGSSTKKDADNNSIVITGGTFNQNIMGGVGMSAEGNAQDNTITIKGNPSFNISGSNPSEHTILYGGYNYTPTNTGNLFTGNTLNLHSKDITVSDVKNFENYNFYLGNDMDKDSTMLKLTSTDATDLSTSKYGVGVKTGTTSLPQGYTVTLIESATALTLSSQNPANDITNMTDIVSGYEFRLSVKDGNKLVAELPYTVTIENSDPSKGSVSNTGEQAYRDEAIAFNATPNLGYVASASSTCGTTGSWSGNTYTSSEITKECTITVNWEEINYTIGGTISGLNGSVTLQNNTGKDLTLNANGEFTFTTTAVHDENYSVTISTQPKGQKCIVDNGSGTIDSSDISDITVTCSDVTIFSDSFE